MAIAGYSGDTVFSSAAVRSIHRASRGVPRLINILANKALMLAFGEGHRRVAWRHVRAAIGDTPAASEWGRAWIWAALVCVACTMTGWLLLTGA